MKLIGDKIYNDVKASSFTFLTERTCSEPVEDTDTTSFVAEFVSIFSLFFLPFVCLFIHLFALTLPLLSVFVMIAYFFLESSFAVIC